MSARPIEELRENLKRTRGEADAAWASSAASASERDAAIKERDRLRDALEQMTTDRDDARARLAQVQKHYRERLGELPP